LSIKPPFSPLEIANHVNDNNGLAWPSQTTIARRTGLSRRWVGEVIADLVAVGELQVIPEGAPNGEMAYRVLKGCELTSHPPSLPCELSSKKGANSVRTESYIEESILLKNSGAEEEGEEERRLTKEEAVSKQDAIRIGLTPGSKLFRFVTGELDG
jgi:hypothetical protein